MNKYKILRKYAYTLYQFTFCKYTNHLQKLYKRRLVSHDEYIEYLPKRWGRLEVYAEILNRDIYKDLYHEKQIFFKKRGH